MPIIAAIVGKPNFNDLTFTIHHSVFTYGAFISDVIIFVAIAAAVFSFIVKPVDMIMKLPQKATSRRLRRSRTRSAATRSCSPPYAPEANSWWTESVADKAVVIIEPLAFRGVVAWTADRRLWTGRWHVPCVSDGSAKRAPPRLLIAAAARAASTMSRAIRRRRIARFRPQ
jgi:hypothetical protein